MEAQKTFSGLLLTMRTNEKIPEELQYAKIQGLTKKLEPQLQIPEPWKINICFMKKPWGELKVQDKQSAETVPEPIQ
ncbi:hypothetical protein AYI70_g4849 [Smittium culicis]|uniref:Uncharacterized protein n=1 Tax=Smittium culicis TaxID=133412 RepID=A0A1R1XX61_9FUNG|nr:hypothetical protein AYI70_g4849 [Smittium culicis]